MGSDKGDYKVLRVQLNFILSICEDDGADAESAAMEQALICQLSTSTRKGYSKKNIFPYIYIYVSLQVDED